MTMTFVVFHDPLQGFPSHVDQPQQAPQSRQGLTAKRHARSTDHGVEKRQSQKQQAVAQVVMDIQALSATRSTKI